MSGLRLKVGWHLNLAQALNRLGAARMEPAARGRIDQAGRLTGRHLFVGEGVVCIRVRCRSQERLGVGMQRVV